MGRGNIEQHSKFYAVIKAIAGFWHNNIFYRRVIVIGNENINPDHHIIFAPNHQNALMDALAVLFTHKGQPIFLTRADIFKSKFISSILYFLKMLPVFRIRDGYSTLKENDLIFRKTIDVIRNKNGLVILPEGNHAGYRRLRQLKKGICRIAFQAEEESDFKLNIKIIPVGLEFSHYSRFRQVLTVVYGKPIEVSDYHELYRKSPEIALNELRSRLSKEIMKLMVHIESEEDYDAIDELRSLLNGRYSDDVKNPKLFRDRILIDKLNKLKIRDIEAYKKILALMLNIKKRARDLNTDYSLLRKKSHPLGWLVTGIVTAIITFPVFVLGNIFTFMFLDIPDWQVKNVKDVQFHSSLKYGFSLGLAFVFLPLLLALSLSLITPVWLGLIVFIAIPLTGLFAWNYFRKLRRIAGGFRIRKYISSKNPGYLSLKKDHNELMNLIATI